MARRKYDHDAYKIPEQRRVVEVFVRNTGLGQWCATVHANAVATASCASTKSKAVAAAFRKAAAAVSKYRSFDGLRRRKHKRSR